MKQELIKLSVHVEIIIRIPALTPYSLISIYLLHNFLQDEIRFLPASLQVVLKLIHQLNVFILLAKANGDESFSNKKKEIILFVRHP